MDDARGNHRAQCGWSLAPVALIVALTLIKAYSTRDLDVLEFWVIDVLFFSSVGLYLVCTSTRMGWIEWRAAPGQRGNPVLFLLWALGLTVALTVLIALVVITTEYAARVFQLKLVSSLAANYRDALPAQTWVRFLVIAYAAASAGFIEEWLYRARVATILGLTESSNNITFMVISSSLFATAHLFQGATSTLVALFAGILTAVFYQKTPISYRLLALALAHTVIDLRWLASEQ